MSLVISSLKSQDAPEELRQAALDRAHSSPGIPISEGTTSSFWQRESHTLPSSQSQLEDVDIAIIGSGISGLSAAWTILQTCKKDGLKTPSVRVLEARDACSGATGRNGGHVLETALHYAHLKEYVGKEAAVKLTRFRLAHFREMETLLSQRPEIRKRSQFRIVDFVSVYFDAESFQDGVQGLEAFRKDMPEESKGYESHVGEALKKNFQLASHAHGVITGPAGAVWPYRLVTSLFEELKRDFPTSFGIHTTTAVNSISISKDGGKGDEDRYHKLSTSRGDFNARQIIHCTNGHVGHLVPGLRGRVFPIRGQMSAQDPGVSFPSQGQQHSWIFNYHNGFDYLTQLPGSSDGTDSEGEMMLGGGLASTIGHGVEEIGVATDSSINLYADIHLSGALSAIFDREQWGRSSGVKSMWTGTMGFSCDDAPWVGELPHALTNREAPQTGRGAEWAAAGYSGEGMVNAWLSSKAVAIMVLVKEGLLSEEALAEMHSWLPDELCITKERIERAVLPRTLAQL